MDRIVAPDRASLSAHTLPVVPRLDIVARALRQQSEHAQASGQRQALALVGDGGIGKSVLLGQLLAYLDKNLPSQGSGMLALASGAAVLVACASIPPTIALSTVKDADEALGLAVDPLGRFSSGLLGLLTALKSEFGSVTLLIDTLDLLINEHSLSALSNLIAEALDISDVIMTCRSYEFRNYFEDLHQSAPRLVHKLNRLNLPRLDATEIVAWARLYLDSGNRIQTGEESAFILALEGGVEQNGSLRQLCAVPVRLAITCETFAAIGYVPEDLTVTELYDAYWDRRVHRASGKSETPASYAKERAALAIASQIVTSRGSIQVQLPKARVSNDQAHGLSLLLSEGVLRDLNTSWEFFHQTFAEYACARWLLVNGIDSDEVKELGHRLQAGQTVLWPIASSLMLQVADYRDYIALTGYLPLQGPEGARVHTLAALRRMESDALASVLREAQDDTALMLAVLGALGDTPARHLEMAFNATLSAIKAHPKELTSVGTSTLALLLPRAAPARMAEFLNDALDTLTEVRPHLPQTGRDYFPSSLLRPLIDMTVTSEVLAVMRRRYAILGVAGRQAAIRVHLNRTLSEDQKVDLARSVLRTDRPPLRDDELVRLMQLLWDCSTIRNTRSWQSWRDLLSDNLARDWDDAQIRFVAHLADDDANIRGEVLADLLTGSVQTSVRYVNVFKQLANTHAQWLVDRLLAHPSTNFSLVIGTIAESAAPLSMGATSETRMQLIAWLNPGREITPRNAWAAQIILAGSAVPAHQQIFGDLIASGPPWQVLNSALEAWLFQTPRHVLNELTEQFRLILQANDAETRKTRARLEGRLADEDENARSWIEEVVLRGQSSRIARTAMKTIAEGLRVDQQTVSSSMAAWLGTLLTTVHTEAARRICEILSDERYIDRQELLPIATVLIPIVIQRLRLAAQKGEDSQLSRELIEVLVELDLVSPMAPESVREVFGIVRSRIEGPDPATNPRKVDDIAAAVRDLGHLIGTLMSKRLLASEVRERLAESLRTIDLERLGGRVTKAVSSMLIGMGFRDPDAIDWMEKLFRRTDYGPLTKLAIAEALLLVDGDHVGGRASGLKDLLDCPPIVAAYIVGRLRS